MPVCHYTFHAYGTWLPDRPEGYNKQGRGYRCPDPEKALLYRRDMNGPAVSLACEVQQHALDTLFASQPLQFFELLTFAADSTHLHAVVAWKDDRVPKKMQTQIKTSMTRSLNLRYGKRQWFVANAGQTPVRDEQHLYRIAHEYLPKHSGVYWMRKIKRKGEV